jgi:hypothetical protein
VFVIATAVSFSMIEEDWKECYVKFEQYARENKCSSMMAFTQSEALLERVQQISKPMIQLALTWEVRDGK